MTQFDETLFRLIFVALWMIFLGIWLVTSYVITPKRDTGRSMRSRLFYSSLREATRREGKLNVAARTIFAPYWVAAWVLYMIYPDWMARFSLPLSTLTRWIAVGMAVISLPLLLWAQHELGEQYSRILNSGRGHWLVTGGPYRWIRHPMYTAGSLFMLGVAIESSNWLVAPAMIAGGILLLARAGWEESMLLERFGEEYRTYMSRTGRFLPRLRYQEKGYPENA